MICDNCGKEIESYIGITEFANRVGLSRSSIERHVKDGSIKAFEYQGYKGDSYSKKKLIPESEISNFREKFLKPVTR